eukprot:8539342-Heterocapsa_arctica.AAC.1
MICLGGSLDSQCYARCVTRVTGSLTLHVHRCGARPSPLCEVSPADIDALIISAEAAAALSSSAPEDGDN